MSICTAALRGLASVAALSLCVAAAPAAAAAVGDALDRPALATLHGAQSVMLGAAHAEARIVAVGERGLVMLSDDAGAHWRQVSVPVSVSLTAVRFADANHGMIVGHGGVVLTSSDAGQSWTRRLDGKRMAQLALDAAQASGDATRLKEAQRLVADGADKPLLDLELFDAKHALVVGAYGLAYTTADGGQSWSASMDRLDNPKGLHLYSVRRLGDTVLIAGEQGLVLLSGDAGQSFKRLALPYKGSFFTAELPGPAELVVAGLRGNVWRSVDAGASWVQMAVPMPVSITGSARAADGTLLLVNQAGRVLVPRSAGWQPLPGRPLPPLNGLLPLNDGALLALTIQGLITLPASALPTTPSNGPAK